MKKLLLLLCSSAFVLTASAQDDDLYFVPSKKSSKKTTTERYETPSRDNEAQTDTHSYDNWADGRGNGNWDVDAYNRRTTREEVTDTAAIDPSDEAKDLASGDYTARLVRFHSPRAGIIVSSPYYSDIIDVWVDPWYYNSWYSPWGWYDPWYYSWHSAYWYHSWGWGWSYYPHYSWNWGWGWCDPWYHHHHHWHPTWGGTYPSYYAGNIGPRGGYVGRYNRGGAYTTSRPSRDYTLAGTRNTGVRGTTNRNNRTSGSSAYRPSRSFGQSGTTTRGNVQRGSVSRERTFTPSNTTRFNNSGNTQRNSGNTQRNSSTRTTPSTRSTTTRSSIGSGGNSGSSRSFGNGGGSSRSFGGGGGGRSMGGRR